MSVIYDTDAAQEKIISIEPIKIDAVQIVKKETVVSIPRIEFIDEKQTKYITEEASTIRYVEEIRPTIRYMPEDMPTIRYQAQLVPYEIPDLAETVAWLKKEMMEVVELKEKLNDLISDSREEISKILEEIKNSIPDSIPMPVITEVSYEVKIPKFVEYEVKNYTIKEETIDVIKPNFITKDYDVIGSIKVRS